MNKILLAIVAASVFVASCNTSLTVQRDNTVMVIM